MRIAARVWWAARRAGEHLAGDAGASFAEYLILLVLIAGAMMVSIPNLRDAMVQQVQSVTQKIQAMTMQ